MSNKKIRVLLISGPNLELLGTREPEIYGFNTLDENVEIARTTAELHDLELEHFQSGSEAEIVKTINESDAKYDALIINPGALTHYAWSLHDSLKAFSGAVVELHISNPNARESWRHTSVVSPVATGTIMGFGSDGYRLAVEATAAVLRQK